MSKLKRPGLLLALLGLAVAPPAFGQSIYWVDTNFPSPSLGKANADGTSPMTIPLAAGTLPEGVALDQASGKVFWVEAAWTDAKVRRADADLTGLADLVPGGSVLRDVDFDATNAKLYWTSSNLVGGSMLHRADADGTNPVVLASLGTAVNLRGVTVDVPGDRVFLADYDGGQILVRTLAGAPGGTAIPAPGTWGVAWDDLGGVVYWADYAGGRIMRADPGTGTSVPVVSGLGNPTYVDFDPIGGKVYWVEATAGAQKIQRANFDGTMVEDLGLTIGAYGGIAVERDRPTPTLLLMLQAEPVADGIELRWQFASADRYRRTDVERAGDSAGPWTVVGVETRMESGQSVVLDRDVVGGRTYLYRLAALLPDGTTERFGPISATAGGRVTEFALGLIAPNPTLGSARIDYAIPRAAKVRLTVLDVQGREVATLYEGMREPGVHQAVWSGQLTGGRAAAGLYFVRFQTPDRDFTQRVVVQR